MDVQVLCARLGNKDGPVFRLRRQYGMAWGFLIDGMFVVVISVNGLTVHRVHICGRILNKDIEDVDIAISSLPVFCYGTETLYDDTQDFRFDVEPTRIQDCLEVLKGFEFAPTGPEVAVLGEYQNLRDLVDTFE